MSVVTVSRTDRLLREIVSQVDRQRVLIDAAAAPSSISVIVHFERDGKMRRVQVRLDTELLPCDQERER